MSPMCRWGAARYRRAMTHRCRIEHPLHNGPYVCLLSHCIAPVMRISARRTSGGLLANKFNEPTIGIARVSGEVVVVDFWGK
jgi:hypothetical protein